MDDGAPGDGRRVRAGIVVTGMLDAADTAQAAVEAERAGWDAVFVWETVWGLDAWVRLTAAAAATSRVRLGTMLTPLPRIRPWDLASRAVTLDRFSGGRVQLAVGLGAPHEGWTAFEPDPGRRERARLLEEGLAVYDGLMRGQPFSFSGSRYVVRPTTFAVPPPPVQQPRVPVWVVGAWDAAARAEGGDPVTPGLRRAARWDGVLPAVLGERSWARTGPRPRGCASPRGRTSSRRSSPTSAGSAPPPGWRGRGSPSSGRRGRPRRTARRSTTGPTPGSPGGCRPTGSTPRPPTSPATSPPDHPPDP